MCDWIKKLFGFKSKCSCEESNYHCEDGKCKYDDKKEAVSSTPVTEASSEPMTPPASMETPMSPSEPMTPPAPEEKPENQL
ncbi:hypothetical protein GW920_00970 [Candidatus Falkowbacteria bacterium]|uniref:Uncharacterized protein n=1 Tax=Candidatus Falkowbacteria bacterium CG10_big_fil_rev_8_21_14_0_10_37_18 TaxID=1974562 RepID=A0A2H0V972_9BACT|nr:hypothetical protein [Candidatus Falkowbacteria bacterium]NCQ12743.1 hypothetical protein [Candidatus Falkowbacteria bacterium]OIO05380.1 MAG: hypothetical protein AUJ26_03355 [Candidatus Falkowbacteria bacterium CG1_02_37_21]PIR95611.1 MAG: hypothetical protein COT93_01625 [Candidatus Falkowbacteria bacterium CG10_big_fil_rev_8_21_14_0_10_37_18]